MQRRRGGCGNVPALGLNLGTTGIASSPKPFMDLFKCSSDTWAGTGSAAVDSNGWLTNMPTGTTVSRYVLIPNYPNETAFLGGAYVLTWTGPLAVTIEDTGGMITSKVSTSNRITFTLPNLTDANKGNVFLAVRVTNSTGVDQSINSIRVFRASDEAALDAGDVFQPEWLASISGVSVIRVMDWLAVNNSNAVNFSDLPTESKIGWNVCPPSIMGKLGSAVGSDLWVCVPARLTTAAMTSLWQAISAQYPAGRVYVQPTNEPWNTAFTQDNYLGDTKSIGLTIVDRFGAPSTAFQDKVACATAQLAFEAWSTAEAVFGRSRIVRVVDGQSANFNYLAAEFQYADTSATYYGGAQLKTLVDAYAIAPYFYGNLDGDGTVLPVDQSQKAMLARKDYLEVDSYFTAKCRLSVATAVGQVASSRASLSAIAPGVALISYELGTHIYVQKDNYSTTYAYQATVNTGTNRLDFSEDISAAFDDGEQGYAYVNGAKVLFTGYAGWGPFWVKKDGTTSLIVYSSQANYDSNTPATLLSSTGGTSPVDGWYVQNYTRSSLLADKWRTWHDGAEGAKVYEEYYQGLRANGLTLFNHFTDSSGYQNVNGNARSSFQFALSRSPYEAAGDYKRFDWFRALTAA